MAATTTTTTLYSIPIPNKKYTKNSLPFSSLSPRTSPFLSLRSSSRAPPPSAAAAAVTAGAVIEADRQTTTSATPSKSLPFRVGHGFDLHRLEPGYPLIIGGIDIPFEKGCKAHSDGKKKSLCVCLFLQPDFFFFNFYSQLSGLAYANLD